MNLSILKVWVILLLVEKLKLIILKNNFVDYWNIFV